MKKRPPRRRPAVAWAAVPAALVLAGLAYLGGQHFAAEHDWTGAGSQLRTAAEALTDATPATWLVASAFAGAAIGLIMLVLACAPARRSHLPAGAGVDLWISARALAAMAADAAERAPGVLSSRAEVRRRVRVHAVVAPGAGGVEGIREAVQERVAELTDREVTVRVKEHRR